jgi:hypothetical protein
LLRERTQPFNKIKTTYISNRLAQYFGLGNHAYAVCRLPQGTGERIASPFLQVDSYAQVLNAATEEELVSEEGANDGRDASSQTRPSRARAAVVDDGVDLAEQPVVRRTLDREDAIG